MVLMRRLSDRGSLLLKRDRCIKGEFLKTFFFPLSYFLDPSKLQNPSRKQSVSRSLKHLFNSSNKFVKTLKRFVFIIHIFSIEP